MIPTDMFMITKRLGKLFSFLHLIWGYRDPLKEVILPIFCGSRNTDFYTRMSMAMIKVYPYLLSSNVTLVAQPLVGPTIKKLLFQRYALSLAIKSLLLF